MTFLPELKVLSLEDEKRGNKTATVVKKKNQDAPEDIEETLNKNQSLRAGEDSQIPATILNPPHIYQQLRSQSCREGKEMEDILIGGIDAAEKMTPEQIDTKNVFKKIHKLLKAQLGSCVGRTSPLRRSSTE